MTAVASCHPERSEGSIRAFLIFVGSELARAVDQGASKLAGLQSSELRAWHRRTGSCWFLRYAQDDRLSWPSSFPRATESAGLRGMSRDDNVRKTRPKGGAR